MAKPQDNMQSTDKDIVEGKDGRVEEEACPNCRGKYRDNMSEGGSAENDITAGVSADGNDSSEQEQVNEWKDKYLRLSAEFDNYRKRTLKEKMDLIVLGGEDIIRALLPVLDDMDRALDAMHKTDDVKAVRIGIELIAQKLRDTLRNKGIDEIAAIGTELDTDFHEAVAKIPAADGGQKGKIVEVVQKGYTFKDKVLRHSKVVVGE